MDSIIQQDIQYYAWYSHSIGFQAALTINVGKADHFFANVIATRFVRIEVMELTAPPGKFVKWQ